VVTSAETPRRRPERHCVTMDYRRKAHVHKQLLAFSRYIVIYISKSYFYVFINVCGSRLFSNPVTYFLYAGNVQEIPSNLCRGNAHKNVTCPVCRNGTGNCALYCIWKCQRNVEISCGRKYT